jgi:dinuclear metal center YbgI/SA1388 family protein
MIPTLELAAYLDEILETASVPDYPNAVNGLQFGNKGYVTRVAACVDFSGRAVNGAVEQGADMLLVHHGMFWGGVRPVTGHVYQRHADLIRHDLCVYSSHLPLDRHSQFGNNVLLSEQLGLVPSGDFGSYKGVSIGIRGEAEVPTSELASRASAFAARHGGSSVVTPLPESRMTRAWAVCTGAGASAETLAEAAGSDIDTLIVGEGPHWTAVEASDLGIAIIYAGHYATETLGVMALAEHLAERFGLDWSMIDAPTGL